MTKPMVKRDAEVFAEGVLRGRRLKIEHLEAVISKKGTRIAYLEKRITKLAKLLADCQMVRDDWCAEYTKLRDSARTSEGDPNA
jgi:hypothetical protein